MKQNKKTIAIENTNTWRVLLLLLIPFAAMAVIRLLKLNNEADVKIIMRLALAGLGAYGAYTVYKGRMTAQKLVLMLVIAGIILRSGYTIYTHAFTRAFDIGMNDETGTGHWAYLNYVMQGKLPESNEYQFYQPPFYYILSAFFIKIMMLLSGSNSWSDFMHVAQAVSCAAECASLIFFVKLMDKLGIKKITQLIPIALAAFYPAHILVAGRMNNDSLAFMLMVMALYFTAAWHKEQKIGYIIGIAFSIGFGMMTKINVGLTALITGPVMLYHLIMRIRSKDKAAVGALVVQLAVFAVIVFPLGLWYPVRNLVRFGQPLGYVHVLGTNSHVYTGGASFFDRWIKLPLLSFVKQPYMDISNDTSIWKGLIVTGVHSEFKWESSALLAWLLDYTHIVILLVCLAAVAGMAFSGREIAKAQRISLVYVWCLFAVMYIQFNIAYPYMCSADFRYLLTGQLTAGAILGLFTEYCIGHRDKGLYKALGIINISAVALFCILGMIKIC